MILSQNILWSGVSSFGVNVIQAVRSGAVSNPGGEESNQGGERERVT